MTRVQPRNERTMPCWFQDEAMEMLGGPAPGRTPEDALERLAGYADIAVVTLGERGELPLLQRRVTFAVEGP